MADEHSNIQASTEHSAKLSLAAYGVKIPEWTTARDSGHLQQIISTVQYPCVLKAQGLAHKSDHGAVIVNIKNKQTLLDAATDMLKRLPSDQQGFLIEAMVTDVIAELLIGITRDPTGLLVLTLGFGGTLTELIDDSVSILLPCNASDIGHALTQLKLYPLLTGYRGASKADLTAIVDAIVAIAHYAQDNALRLVELEVNPLLARAKDAVAADALLRLMADP